MLIVCDKIPGLKWRLQLSIVLYVYNLENKEIILQKPKEKSEEDS